MLSSPLPSSTRAVLLFHVHILLFLLLFFITASAEQCHRIFFPHLECCHCRLCNGPPVIIAMLQLQRRFGGQDDDDGPGGDAVVVERKPLLNLSPPAQVLLHHHHHCHHTCHYCDNQPRLPPPPKTPENHRLPPSPVATTAATISTITSCSSILDDRLDCGHCDGDGDDDAVQYSSQPLLRRRSNHRLAHLDASDCRRRSCCSSSSSSCTAPDRSTSVDVVSGCKPQSTRTTLTVQSAKAAEAQTSSTSTTQIQTATTSYYRVHQLTQTSSSHLNNCLGLCDVIMLSKRKRRKGEEEIATGGICLSRTSPTPTPSSSSVLSPLKPPPSRVSSLPLSLFSSLSSSFSTSTSSSSSQLTTTYLCRRFLLFLLCLFTVISASSSSSAFAYSSSSHINGGSYHNFDQLQQTGGGEFPPYYSQYYPPYLVEDVRVQPAPPPSSNRQGKSRPLAKAPSVPAARLYLDPATFTGGEVTGHAVLRRRNPGGSTPQTFDMSDSDQLQQPDYLITGDIFVPPGARLEIEPGVRIAFAPRVGLTVRGSLLANVSSADF